MPDYENLRRLAESIPYPHSDPLEHRDWLFARALLAALDADECADMSEGKFKARRRLAALDKEAGQ